MKEKNRRYDRQIALPEWGNPGQEKVAAAKVLIVGAGGLGVPVLQYLAAAGVGHLGIIDEDVVDISNIHRQPLYDADDCGRNKATVAAEKIFQLNPEVQTTVFPFHLQAGNVANTISTYDIIVDASDNFPTRYCINDAAVLLNKPIVYGAVSAMEGQLSVLNYQEGPTYRCLFPTPPSPGSVPDCESTGIMGTIPGTIGMLMATEVLKMITGVGYPLRRQLLTWRAYMQNFFTFEFDRNANYRKLVPEDVEALSKMDYPAFCGIQTKDVVTPEIWHNTQSAFRACIDVREENEMPPSWENAIRLPLSSLQKKWDMPALNGQVLVYCQTGNRTQEAIRILQKKYPDVQFVTLHGGIKAWQLFEMNRMYGRTQA